MSIAVPGAVEAFTGETAATSLILGVGAAFGTPALHALFLHQSARAQVTTFDTVAYAVNMIGLCLFACVVFALNLVVFHLDEPVAEDALAGAPTAVLLATLAVFAVGSVLFGVSMLRARVHSPVAAWGYMLSLTLLALLAPLPDSPLVSALHVAAGATLLSLSVAMWRQPVAEGILPV